jgi:NAD(P)-dependent dehydrogenase (short-subunit alcohol dehydrogenase family)
LLLEAYPAALDVSRRQSIAEFVQYAETTLGGVDLLINNAAVCEEGWSRSAVARTMRTNVLGPVALTRGVLPGMLRRNRGHVVNISSGDGELVYLSTALQHELEEATSERAVLRVLARAAPPRNAFGLAPAHGRTPAYSTSKAALNALTRLVAARLPPPEECGVRISAVCPGDVATRMLDREDATAFRLALPPSTAARDVLRLANAGLTADAELPSGRFWRHGHQIDW